MNLRLYFFLAIFVGFCGLSLLAVAQDQTDALRYSYLSPQGTARSIGIGGALGSIGGDFTSLSVNPAGIGVYRTSEFMFTPSLKLNNVSGTYINNTMDDNNVRFNFNNIGVIFTSAAKGQRYERSAWKSVSFGLGINRLADFNKNTIYGGTNTTTSFGEVFVTDAINFPGDIDDTNTPAGIGWESYLIDEDSLGFFSPVIARTDPALLRLNQRRILRERGGISELVLSFGGNYQEKLMLGATLGLPVLSYKRDLTFEETDASGISDNDFQSLNYKESLSASGLGINLKLGFIYRATDNFRVGAAIHTPTYFGISEVQNRSITTNTEGLGGIVSLSQFTDPAIDENVFEYGLTTPWRGVLSATALLGKFGFITADYEYVDYKSARFRYDNTFSDAESLVNQMIKNTYRGASNFRLGAEGRMENLMLRLGFGYYGNPHQSGGDSRLVFSGGAGYRFNNWFMDLGFAHTSFEETQQPYRVIYPTQEFAVPTARLKNSLNNVALTLGWKFN